MKIRPAIKSDIKELVAFQMAMAQETENITLDKANQNAIQVYEKTGMQTTNYQMLEWTKP